MNKVELETLVRGALQEQFSKSFEKVIENLQNPNTSFKVNREINIKLKFAQNENRDNVTCAVQVAEKLAPQSPMTTNFAIGTDLKTGEMYAEEYGKHIKGQLSIDDVQTESVTETVIDGRTVDTTTGEIKAVVDFRKAATN